ncbi:divalent-cation tolerance protein CutA [Natronorarus salvus]|uniref:divalent-cation tolerance protein CutA n=1 Tax=Natronorarus salvus TaxID=3117733 RepID=UPI002F263485
MPTVYVTAPRADASALARQLVDDRLAACVNLVPCRSVYRWEGEVVEDEESILLVKTTGERYDELVDRVEELHPHDVPCIERFDERDVLPAFGEWIDAETTGER